MNLWAGRKKQRHPQKVETRLKDLSDSFCYKKSPINLKYLFTKKKKKRTVEENKPLCVLLSSSLSLFFTLVCYCFLYMIVRQNYFRRWHPEIQVDPNYLNQAKCLNLDHAKTRLSLNIRVHSSH